MRLWQATCEVGDNDDGDGTSYWRQMTSVSAFARGVGSRELLCRFLASVAQSTVGACEVRCGRMPDRCRPIFAATASVFLSSVGQPRLLAYLTCYTLFISSLIFCSRSIRAMCRVWFRTVEGAHLTHQSERRERGKRGTPARRNDATQASARLKSRYTSRSRPLAPTLSQG